MQYFQSLGVHVKGLDIAESSVRYLRQQFPATNFYRADIPDTPLPISDSFRLISAISVLYHIVDDARFERVLTDLVGVLASQGIPDAHEYF